MTTPRRFRRPLARAAAAALLAGLLFPACGNGQAAAGERPDADSVAAAIRAKGKASLDDCYRLALAASETVGMADERLVQARSRESAGVGTLLPQLSLEGTAFRQNDVGSGTGATAAIEPHQEELKVRLDQAVTRFGAEWSGVNSSGAGPTPSGGTARTPSGCSAGRSPPGTARCSTASGRCSSGGTR